jgi:hypothetical protein
MVSSIDYIPLASQQVSCFSRQSGNKECSWRYVHVWRRLQESLTNPEDGGEFDKPWRWCQCADHDQIQRTSARIIFSMCWIRALWSYPNPNQLVLPRGVGKTLCLGIGGRNSIMKKMEMEERFSFLKHKVQWFHGRRMISWCLDSVVS